MTARDNITEHYAGDGEIARRIDEQLRLSGLTDDHILSPSDLAAVDQFHVGGLEATQELARLFSPSRGSYVLDIGSGLGGPSRYLATNYGCRVIGIDITEEYRRVASALGARMRLEDRVEYRRGDARELLFPDGTFDGAWTQHVSMNIAEKKELYEGIRRVLKIGGRFALHDVVQRTPGPILFPVPWARTQEISHLQTMEVMRETILDAGFVLVAWNDVTGRCIAVSRRDGSSQQERRDAAPGTASRAGAGFSGAGEEFSAKSRGRTVWCRPSRIPARFVGDSVYERDELFGQA
jgi:SAM-dependent methyltransferase